MGLREFADRQGRAWRVWEVTSENIHPALRVADYMRHYVGGWLAFESVDGTAKCRLTPIPERWTEASEEQLEEWLRLAESVRGERESPAPERKHIETVVAIEPQAERPSVRSFRFPGGRIWCVAERLVQTAAERGTAQVRRVLQFTSGSRSLELHSWPTDWWSFTAEQLAALLSGGFPRSLISTDPGMPRRRLMDSHPA